MITAVLGDHAENTLAQLAEVDKNAAYTALMADGHLGYVMPVGGVAAYRDMISVVGVGFDIACGNCAIKTDVKLSDFGKSANQRGWQLEKIADEIQDTISFGVGRTNKADDAPTDHALFNDPRWNIIRERAGHGEMRKLRDRGRQQLGTVGSGNHYVDVFVGTDGYLWVGVHFGSRGLGHGIATGFLNLGLGGEWFEKKAEQEVLLSMRSSMGQDYFELMNLCGEYAYAGREWVTRTVVKILGGKEMDLVHNHHNFAWKETHFGEELYVVRKGATPAFPGQRGFVGGSMGDNAVILEGTQRFPYIVTPEVWTEQENSLFSTVHGAGRVMSRTEAAGKRDRKTGQLVLDKETGLPKKPGKVTPEMMQTWLSEKGVILRGGGLDESPHAYRRLPEVLEHQGNTVTVLETLTPIIVVMAGSNEFDPYKD